MRRRALAAAFPHTIPVLTGYAFLGVAYGIYMRVSGFPFWYPTLSNVVIFGGSLEFVLVSMLMSSFAPLQTFLMALMIQARHLFYGIALLEKYRHLGKMRFYLIFGMTDESFSVNCSAEIPDGVDEGWFYLFVTLLDHCYWVTACTVGGLLGSLISFDTQGLDFVMTAMFVVIFLNQLMKERKHYTALIGLLSSVGCLVLFGAESFLIPTMLTILLLLTVFRRPLERAGDLK
ncbi:MAG: AzlC family ABC transporter permease [Oscillospiraceae bacterium]|nr:AzlC family ABC transporter permease [Oscillospiraceae bacterium]